MGTVTGTVTDAAGTVKSDQHWVSRPLHPVPVGDARQATQKADVAQIAASCVTLDLVLGPSDLNLLGLQLHLDPVRLTITAVPDAGNLLGNLLCAIAGSSDGPEGLSGILTQLVSVLHLMLGTLGQVPGPAPRPDGGGGGGGREANTR